MAWMSEDTSTGACWTTTPGSAGIDPVSASSLWTWRRRRGGPPGGWKPTAASHPRTRYPESQGHRGAFISLLTLSTTSRLGLVEYSMSALSCSSVSTPSPSMTSLTASGSPLTDVKTLSATTGVYTFSSKAPSREAVSTTPLLPVTCMNTMLQHSRMLGLTFPGIMLDPGSTAGRVTSPRPAG